MTPAFDAWDPWTPAQVHELLRGCEAPWSVAAGWALDLHHGRQTREHEDIEIGLPRSSFDLLRPHLAAFDLYAAGSGSIDPLTEANLQEKHQIWSATATSGAWIVSPSPATPRPGSATATRA